MKSITVNYLKEDFHGSLLLRKKVGTEPRCGEVVFIQDNYYRIKDVKYDYEVWQSVGIKVFDAVVSQLQKQTYEFDFYVVDDDNISLFGIKDRCPKEVFIPSHICSDGHMIPVTFVSWMTFVESCEVIYLPDTVRSFELMDEEGIKEVFMDNACQLEDFTCINCVNLMRVTLPVHIDKLSEAAFAGCKNLREVITENSEIQFSQSTFTGCKNLSKDLSFLKDDFVIEKGLLFNRSKNEVYTYLGDDGIASDCSKISFPPTVTYIGNGFSNTDITSVDLSQTSITEIENDTFSDCCHLSKVFLPNNLKRIGDRAFSNCGSLQEITLPSSLEEIGIACFSGTGIRQIEIPRLLKLIPKSAFACCKNLERISIPPTVRSINSFAFRDCTAVRYVNISSGFKKDVHLLFEKDAIIQFVYSAKPVPVYSVNTGAYTHGSLVCPYCGSRDVRTYCDGTAECQSCRGEFIYWRR